MRVAIINITGGGMSEGYRKYLQNIIPRMVIHPKVRTILCASPKSIKVQDWFGKLPNVKFVDCQPFRFLGNKFDPKFKQHLKEFSPDVIFIPIERFFRFGTVPIVNMVQNMEPIVGFNSGSLSEWFWNWIRRQASKSPLKKSDRIITLSEHSYNFLNKYWNIPGDKIGLVYHGIELPQKDIYRPKIIPKEWENQFLFTAGSIRPARGLEDLLYALKDLADNFLNFPPLVIAGEASPGMEKYKKRLKDWVRVHKLSPKIYWTGGLNEKEMSWCYKNCQVFIMTSRIESFALIAGEAMAHGCLSISSDSSCLPEIFDKTAIFYPAKEPKILAKRIYEVLNWAEEKKQKMRQLALTRASQFSWDRCVEQTVTELAKVIKNRIE